MTTEIAITLLLIFITLFAFVKEIAPGDVVSLTMLVLCVFLGLISQKDMLDVFKNEAPVTIGALFIIGTAIEKSGGVLQISQLLERIASGGLRSTLLLILLVASFFSAWMNNTAIVAIMLPVTLGLARTKNIASSKLLIPLSYASILGGCCTLIGTSTNIVVSGKLKDMGLPELTMFELGKVGVPLALVGIVFIVFLGPKLLPDRTSVIGILDDKQRTSPLFHVLVSHGSPMIGMKLLESPLADSAHGIQLMEIRRNGERVMQHMNQITIAENDRFLIGVHGTKNKSKTVEEIFPNQHLQTLSKIDGVITELVVAEESDLLGKTLAATDFRQHFNSVVLAVHRNGKNITKQLADEEIDHGDTLLVLTPKNNLQALADSHNFILTDAASSEKAPGFFSKATLTWAVLIAVVTVTTVMSFFSAGSVMCIASLTGALAILWMKVISPREAYAGIDWPIIFMLYGMLALGIAMEKSGASQFIAHQFVEAARAVSSPQMLNYVTLSAIILLTIILTEMLSNNAVALMMVPIVVKTASELGVNHQPFIIGVCVAASTAFMIPMGYQTHMMVYGPGGYRFSDFIKVGLPMNVISWILASFIIPVFWHF